MIKIILTTVVGLIAAAAVGVWYFSDLETNIQGIDQAMVTDGSRELVPTTNPDQIKGRDSIMSLFKLGKSMECTFSFSSGDMRGEGAGFFYKNKSRVDSLYSGTEDGPMASYMITDGATNMMYSWFFANGEMTGMKMVIPDPTSPVGESMKPPQTPATTPQITPETDVTYDCKPWNVDSSVFVPPTDVEFIDMSEMQMKVPPVPIR